MIIFHAHSRYENNKFYTDGGRVLGLTVVGSGILEVIDKVYNYIEEIDFEDMHYRTDIGFTLSELPNSDSDQND